MRNPIETVPKDGKAVILEDDSKGTYELAQWSAEEEAWVGANGSPCKIAPTYWLALKRAEHEEGSSSASPQQTGAPLPPELKLASPAVLATSPGAASSEPATVASFDGQVPRENVRPAKLGPRFAASCGAAMVAVSLTYMYFRADFAAYVTKHDDRANALRVQSVPQERSIELPRKISVVSDSTQSEANADSARSSTAQETVGIASIQTPQNNQRADVLETELFKVRQALGEAEERESRLKQATETARTELRQSLDKIVTLEDELALVRQHTTQASPTPRRVRRISQWRQASPKQDGFFGIFNFAPSRARYQRSSRMR